MDATIVAAPSIYIDRLELIGTVNPRFGTYDKQVLPASDSTSVIEMSSDHAGEQPSQSTSDSRSCVVDSKSSGELVLLVPCIAKARWSQRPNLTDDVPLRPICAWDIAETLASFSLLPSPFHFFNIHDL